jgi:hypothetical protein
MFRFTARSPGWAPQRRRTIPALRARSRGPSLPPSPTRASGAREVHQGSCPCRVLSLLGEHAQKRRQDQLAGAGWSCTMVGAGTAAVVCDARWAVAPTPGGVVPGGRILHDRVVDVRAGVGRPDAELADHVVVLVRQVVAVHHVRALVRPEQHDQPDGLVLALSDHVLGPPGRRRGLAVPAEELEVHEVDVHRVEPAARVVLDVLGLRVAQPGLARILSSPEANASGGCASRPSSAARAVVGQHDVSPQPKVVPIVVVPVVVQRGAVRAKIMSGTVMATSGSPSSSRARSRSRTGSTARPGRSRPSVW